MNSETSPAGKIKEHISSKIIKDTNGSGSGGIQTELIKHGTKKLL
jgi:hypothetical protein